MFGMHIQSEKQGFNLNECRSCYDMHVNKFRKNIVSESSQNNQPIPFRERYD